MPIDTRGGFDDRLKRKLKEEKAKEDKRKGKEDELMYGDKEQKKATMDALEQARQRLRAKKLRGEK